MKNYFKLLYILLAIGWLFSCENEPIMYDSSKNHVAFTQGEVLIAENAGMVGIPVMVVATLDDAAVTVDFMFDADQSVASEGTDFTIENDPMTLSFPNGWGYDTIWVTPVDNDVFGGNITFVMRLTTNSLNYQFGAQDSIICTIVDNEHPLGIWIGSYEIEATFVAGYFSDEVWTGIVTEPDPNDVNNLIITGLCGTAYSERLPITASVDLEAMTITLPAGADIGSHDNYGGPVNLYVGTEDNSVDEEAPIVGTINNDGTIEIPMIGIYFAGGINEGLTYGVYNTVWNKVGKSFPIEERRVPVYNQSQIIKIK